MPQNLISLTLSNEQLNAIDGALGVLEQNLSALLAMDASERRGVISMGDKSEAFCRETLHVLGNNPGIVPPDFHLDESLADLAAFDALRPRLVRLRKLLERGDNTEYALGSDLMSAALEGYALLKVAGKNAGLEEARRSLSGRFRRRRAEPPAAPQPA